MTSMWSDEPIGAEQEQEIFSVKLVKIRDGVPLVEIWVRKFADFVRF